MIREDQIIYSEIGALIKNLNTSLFLYQYSQIIIILLSLSVYSQQQNSLTSFVIG